MSKDNVIIEREDGNCPNCERKIETTGIVKTDGYLVGYRFICECGFVGSVWYKVYKIKCKLLEEEK